eukprot:gene3992-2847_t
MRKVIKRLYHAGPTKAEEASPLRMFFATFFLEIMHSNHGKPNV